MDLREMEEKVQDNARSLNKINQISNGIVKLVTNRGNLSDIRQRKLLEKLQEQMKELIFTECEKVLKERDSYLRAPSAR